MQSDSFKMVYHGRPSLMSAIWESGLQVERYIIQAAHGVQASTFVDHIPHHIPYGMCAALGMPPPLISLNGEWERDNTLSYGGTKEEVRTRVINFQERAHRNLAWIELAREKSADYLIKGLDLGWYWPPDPFAPPPYIS